MASRLFRGHQSCKRTGERREAIDKLRTEDVDVVRPSVMAEIPDHLNVVLGSPHAACPRTDEKSYCRAERSTRCQRTPSRAVCIPTDLRRL